MPAVKDHGSVAQLYRRYGGAVFRRCLKLLREEERAVDATQDVFEKVSRALPPFESDEQALRWLYRVTTHHCLDLLEAATRRAFKEERQARWEIVVSPQDTRAEHRQLAYQVLARFDRETQLIAFGALVDGATHAEIAASLDVSTKTVQRKLDHFLRTARASVEEVGR